MEIIRAQDKDPVHHLDAVYPFDKAAGFGHVKPSGYRQRRAVDRADIADNLVGAKFLKGIGGHPAGAFGGIAFFAAVAPQDIADAPDLFAVDFLPQHADLSDRLTGGLVQRQKVVNAAFPVAFLPAGNPGLNLLVGKILLPDAADLRVPQNAGHNFKILLGDFPVG